MSRKHWHGPRRGIRIDLPEGLLAMAGGRGRGGGWGPFHFSFDDDSESRSRGGRGNRRRMFEGGKLRLVLLKLIADEPRHGYDLIKAIEEMTGGRYAPSPGVVYPTITLLEDMGMIAETTLDGMAPGRRVFSATDEGRAHLEENREEIDQLIERLEELAPRESSGGAPPIGRAVKNLMTALSHRVGREGLDEELLHEIAAILDEAARRIERVKPASSD